MADVIHDVLLKAQRSLGISHPTARAAMAQAAQHIVRQDDEISRLRGEVEELRHRLSDAEVGAECQTNLADKLTLENERLAGALTPPEGMDFTISLDRGKWLVALWTSGKPGGGPHVHGYGKTLDEAWTNARAALTATQEKRNGNG